MGFIDNVMCHNCLGLSSLLHWEYNHNCIQGLRFSRHGPRIIHLFYADDCLSFLRNSESSFARVRDILALYEHLYGQKVNSAKSSIYFFPSTTPSLQNHLCTLVGVSSIVDPSMYLGMPLIVGRNKTQAFGFLRDKVSSRVQSWTKNLISYGGCVVYVKAMVQVLPTYVMGYYLILGVLSDITTL
ncbi:uncharacterized protein LOC120179088 [Hibiscus syriacus]|uniref:uncharacterized protein LOC120179088 n=1 Tax=Hibiscus syriacus TaxID=106335 RepID=UPI00192416C7|nr:uncharacterized protein LOC120179088 [Hibiscus syriacus]